MKQIFSITLIIVCYQSAFAQNDILAGIRTTLEDYNKNYPSERLYVHTDKNFYTAGEIVWFKIYQLDSSLSKQGISSRVAYVEILNGQSPVLQTKIEMHEKDGRGSIELPLTLNSGYYTLRAYTSWMKNFGASNFFEKKITIINPLKSLTQNDHPATQNHVDLFPEGGNLVNGIPSQIAFKLTANNGKGIFANGFLIDENNDTLKSFAPYQFGLGSFEFTPDTLHIYKTVFVFDDNTVIAKPLPVVYHEGYVMHVEERGQKINVEVRSNFPGNAEVFLIAMNHQQIKFAKKNTFTEGLANFSFDLSELGQGVNQITIFNSEKQPVCERLFFVQPSQKTTVSATSTKDSYTNREQVSLTISSSRPANLSLAVYKFDSLQVSDVSDINTYVWLESELSGRVENPQYYLSGNSNEIKKAADLLMLTQGWRKFNWNTVLKEKPLIRYIPEISGQVITCKIEDANGNPAKGIQVFLSIPETSYKLYSGQSNDSGIVRMNVLDFYGKSEIVLQTYKLDEKYKIQLINPFFTKYNELQYPVFTISTDKKTSLENYSIAMQTQHIYAADSMQKFFVPDIQDSFPFYGKALYSYKLDDYTRFTTMEEVLREYVREINVGTNGSGNLVMKIFNEDFREFYKDNILVLFDGIPVFNTGKIFSLDPLKIRNLDIITKNYVLGPSLFHALASFSSYSGNHEGMDIEPDAISLDYEGLQIKREFYSPDYSSEQYRKSHIPDLRNTLFWSANVSTDQKVKFYTGDTKGRYLISIQGMSDDGEPLSSTWDFEIK